MKKILTVFTIMMFGLCTFADGQEDALKFFNSFVNAANSYSQAVPSMYSDNAKIIRQIVKPDGSLANAYFTADQYRAQMRLSEKIAKLKNYKNYYSNIKVTKVSNGYRIDSLRRPSLSNYYLKSSMVVQKQSDGRWLIVEELMQTKEQIFLKYAK
ncbi:MAG TPA: hypothetical protein PLG15_03515 [Candidatus Gastranaerophilaceae bacterium]|nr:hypothetical protein [Candidatus Gastranaerophilaceae bacterium]HPT41432.1 hypothetical protein [Candidatus Gastranaerophilaceae bacterium]